METAILSTVQFCGFMFTQRELWNLVWFGSSQENRQLSPDIIDLYEPHWNSISNNLNYPQMFHFNTQTYIKFLNSKRLDSYNKNQKTYPTTLINQKTQQTYPLSISD